MRSQNHTLRYRIVIALFCLCCVIYLGRLFFIQLSGAGEDESKGVTTRIVTVQAVRGEIYDRNGEPLVKNRYTYDLTLTYASLHAMNQTEANRTLLFLLDECALENKHVEKYFPFDGSYPHYRFSEETASGDSISYYRLQRVLGDLGMKKNATPEEITAHYTETYGLLLQNKDGTPVFTNEEIHRLISLYYDMSVMQFSPNTAYVFADDVSMTLMTRIKESAHEGITFSVNAQRVFCYPGYASHILGMVGPIYSEEWEYYNEQGYQMNAIVGKSGVEAAFEQYLRGSDGQLLIREDAAGNVLEVEVLRAPVAGNDVYLTIDIDLQIAAEKGLAENVQYVVDHSGGMSAMGADCKSGAVVAMDPHTGEVLAIASYPTYDLSTYNLYYNELVSDSAIPLLNRAINGSYAPGSTFKPAVAMAGLIQSVVNADTVLPCTGVYKRYDGYHPKCSTYGTNHWGGTDVQSAIATSCNCYFYELGYRMGIDRMNEVLKRFGFGQSTGFELGGTNGILAGPEYRQQIHGDVWTDGLTLSAAIGQSDNQVSPLQLASYLSTLVNGGTRYSAHLLRAVYSFGNATPAYVYDPAANILSASVLPEEHRGEILAGMKEMIASGTAVSNWMKRLPESVTVAGKTGTAQTSTDCENALFICTASENDADLKDPDIVISVVLEKGYQGTRASLTAARVLEAFYGVTE